MDSATRSASALCILDCPDGILLVLERSKPEPHYWKIPGGKAEPSDKSILHTAQRELKEETGILVGVNRIYLLSTIDKGSHDLHICTTVMLKTPEQEMLTPEDEIDEARIFSPSDIISELVPNHKILPAHIGYLRRHDFI